MINEIRWSKIVESEWVVEIRESYKFPEKKLGSILQKDLRFEIRIKLGLIISADKPIFNDHSFHLCRVNRSLFGIDDFTTGFNKNSVG